MKSVIAFGLIGALVTPMALADNTVTALVEQANCVQVGQNESIVGGIVGGAAGSAGGALVGSFFGKTGKKLGALVGGVAGGAYGASGDKIYNCTVLTRVGGETVLVSKQSARNIIQGDTITLVKTGAQWQAF